VPHYRVTSGGAYCALIKEIAPDQGGEVNLVNADVEILKYILFKIK
jgi:hypothetical protein